MTADNRSLSYQTLAARLAEMEGRYIAIVASHNEIRRHLGSMIAYVECVSVGVASLAQESVGKGWPPELGQALSKLADDAEAAANAKLAEG